jgi:hypothetical protein
MMDLLLKRRRNVCCKYVSFLHWMSTSMNPKIANLSMPQVDLATTTVDVTGNVYVSVLRCVS